MARPPGHGPAYEVKRQEIIDTAAALFAKKGYAATGIIEIGDTVGLAKGALYYYIGSKENLLVEIQGRVLDPLLVVAARIQELDAPPLVKLRLLSEELLNVIFERLDHIWVYEHDYRQLTGENLSRMLEKRKEVEHVVRSLLVDAMEDGSLRKADPTLAMLQFLNMHNRTYQWLDPDKRWDAKFLSKSYCHTLFNGFADGKCDLEALEAQVEAQTAASTA
ncbi:TetR/AcrR family transcriptional regulator [Nocardia vinacea]|uniref:TetR/AcrR family transcriptional regulator n=1 Tax=Nocardia vinacea TaxID=96468 RepID=UPI0033E15072